MKKFYSILLFLVYSVCSAQIPTTGLISQWPFSGNANDIIGGNNGTVYNATPIADRFGNSGCAYNFNGTSSYILFTSAGPTGTVSRSLSFWAKTTYTNLTCAFGYGSAGGSFGVEFYYGCPGIGLDNGVTAYMKSAANISNGAWHHYVLVFDASVSNLIGSVAYYMDGALLTNIGCTVGSTVQTLNSNATFPINIGKVSDNNIRFFKGDLDDFFLYNRALTPSEVLALYNDVPCLATPPSPGAISGNISVCQGASYVYSVAPVPGATSYTWSLPGGWIGTSTTNSIMTTAGPNSGTIAVAAGNCCGNSQVSSQDVNVSAAPSLTVTAAQLTICKGNSATLFGNGASTYTWNSFVVTPSLVVSPTVTTTYTLSGTNSSGCASSTTGTVFVTNNTLPTINITGPGTSCPNQTINLASNGAQTYTWQPGNLNGFFVSVSPGVTTTYTVTGTDANGCYNSATYTQTVSSCAGINTISNVEASFVVFPNPNNGTFIVRYPAYKKDSKIELLNELGQVVYETNIESAETKLNLKLSSGFYFIRLSVNGKIGSVQKITISNN